MEASQSSAGNLLVSRYMDIDVDPQVDIDPYTPLMALAAKAPVVAGRDGVFEGVRVSNNFLFRDHGQDVFLAPSWDAWRQVTADNDNFSSEPGSSVLRQTFGKTLMSMDEREHGAFKKLVLPSFSHRTVTSGLTRVAEPIIEECLDAIAPAGQGELIGSFTSVFPYLVVARLFRVPDDMAGDAERLVVDALKMGEYPERDLAALDGMNALFQKVVDRHRTDPADDMTLALMDAEVDGRKLTDDEVRGFLKQIISAGLDTTARQTANLIFLLLENPDLLESAIWESLRVLSPGGLTARVATNDVDVCGVRIPTGSGVYPVIHTANLDPARWTDARKFDIRRKRMPVASFGTGVHACLGMNLALSELTIAMRCVLKQLPNLRKGPERWPGTAVRGFQLRSPTRLPVLWDA